MNKRLRRLCRRDFSTLLTSKYRHSTSEHFSFIFSNTMYGYVIVISKKIAKTAVKRHKLKRQILSILCKNKPHENAVVIFARRGAEKLSFKEIKKELQTILPPHQ